MPGKQPLAEQGRVPGEEGREVLDVPRAGVVGDDFDPGPAHGCVVFLRDPGIPGGLLDAAADEPDGVRHAVTADSQPGQVQSGS
jgi:hypothetical protein